MVEENVLLVDKVEDGKIWVLTMNRPHRLNAVGGGMMGKLTETWKAFRDDPDARVAILTANGRAYSAGVDLKEAAENQEKHERGEYVPPPDERWIPLSERFELWKPTIAAVNGVAVAGGFMFALQCDIRIAAEDAEFGVPEVRWNRAGGQWMTSLTRVIGLGHALELCLWGDGRISAQRAYEMGFVNKVVPREQVMDEAMAWARRMLKLAPRAVSNVKECIYRGYYLSPLDGEALGKAIEQNLEGMEDSIEGPKAFTEKRDPVFKNR